MNGADLLLVIAACLLIYVVLTAHDVRNKREDDR